MLYLEKEKDFQKFAMDRGLTSSNLHYATTQIENSMTPYILEEREMRATQMDIFSRLMRDRVLWLSGVVSDNMSNVTQAQLLYLDSISKEDIKMYINTPGGSVIDGLGIYDLMNFISCDIATTNLALCASMGSILLSSGTKGKRYSLVSSKVMIHQVSAGTRGHVEDMRISQMETEKYNYILFKILAENSGKTFEEVLEVSRRDHWLNSSQSKEFGFVDEIIGLDKPGVVSIDERLAGFNEYYNREVLKEGKIIGVRAPIS